MHVLERLSAFSVIFAASFVVPSVSFGSSPSLPAVPLRFEKGAGLNSYIAAGIGVTASVDSAGFNLLLPHPLRVSVLHADARAEAHPLDPLAVKSAYFLGPSEWRAGVASYGRVRYNSVLPGIDLVYHSEGRNLEFDFVVHPGADPSRIALRFGGQDDLRIDDDGNLVASAGGASVVHKAPAVYQRTAAGLRLVSGAYRLDHRGDVRFDIGPYDLDTTLVIDPVVVFSAFRGGSSFDRAVAIARDRNGNVFVAGNTSSGDFPVTEGAYQETRSSGQDVFVMKINPALPSDQAVQYVTYFGGGALDEVTSMAVDHTGDVYLVGFTTSTNLPVTSPSHQSQNHGERDAFLVKFAFGHPNAESLLAYSTYFGGTGNDAAYGVAVDELWNVFVVGSTASTDIETKGANVQSQSGGGTDGFVARFDVFGTLIYSTYLGGERTDSARAVALGPNGSIWVAMNTLSPGLPVSGNAFNPEYWSGGDVYLARMQILGDDPGIRYGTYLGGPEIDNVAKIAVDPQGRVVIAGPTQSADFPRAGISQPSSGATDVFVSVIDTAQSGSASLVFSTLLGGKDHDWPYDMAVTPAGDIVVTGYTLSSDFPASSGAQTFAGLADAFATKLRADSGITYSTYIGGAQNDYGYGVAVDPTGNIWLAGATSSVVFPAGAGNRGSTPGDFDAFVYAFQPCTFLLSASSNTVNAGGLSATFLVSTTGDCSWTAAPTADWIRVTSGGSGTGNGEVTYEVLANPLSAERAASINIGGQQHTVRQLGVECKVTLEPDATMGPGSDVRGLVIQTSAPDCSWSASTTTTWITITQNQTGTGNGMMIYSVEPNPETVERVATIEVNGVVFRLTQRGRQ